MKKSKGGKITIVALLIIITLTAIIFRKNIYSWYRSTFIPIGPGGMIEDSLTRPDET